MNGRVEYYGKILIDLTGDTVTPETLIKGATAHDKAGNLIVGIKKDFENDLKSVIDRSVTELISDVSFVGDNAFRGCKKLKTVFLPNCSRIGDYAFRYCDILEKVDLPVCSRLDSYSFYGCMNLLKLILRSENLVQLDNINAFSKSAIETGTGYIYVPGILLESYKTALNWSTFANQFRAIEDYQEI